MDISVIDRQHQPALARAAGRDTPGCSHASPFRRWALVLAQLRLARSSSTV